MASYRVDVKGNEFGETYHTALAVITCTGNGTPVKPRWVDTTSDNQKCFLGKVALYMQLQKSPNSQIFFKKDLINDVGVRGLDDQPLSSNKASEETANALKKIRLVGDAELRKEKKLIRDVFLFNPALDEALPKQAELDGNIRQSIVKELADRHIDTVNEKVVIFNRQQSESPNRNLTKDMLVAIIQNSAVNHFLINSSSNQEQAFDNLLESVPKNLKQGKTFTHLGKFIQEKKKQDGTKDESFNRADGFTFQLNVLDVLNQNFKTTRVYGVKSGALDGPAFIGIRTIYCLGAGDNDERIKYIGLYYSYGRLDIKQ